MILIVLIELCIISMIIYDLPCNNLKLIELND
jgi:hypothetical protein